MATIVSVSACGNDPLPSPRPPSAAPVASPSAPPVAASPTPVAVVGSIPPLDCESIASTIIDYADGLTGVPDIVAATISSREIEHLPDDQVVVDGNVTAVVRDDRTFYIFEWFQPEGGGWLLGGTQSCADPNG